MNALRCCVVGTGPSGFYTAKYLLQANPSCIIDFVERLPTPFGLVRFGVAPDHQEVKSVQSDFIKVVEDHPNRVRFFGNVGLGRDVSLEELKKRYHAVVLAYGAEKDRELGLKGEKELVRSAREFVAWYNGHPDVPQSTCEEFERVVAGAKDCVVVGNGNVAIDCARILLAGREKLEMTDIAPRALTALVKSSIKTVTMVGRRGHPQASFTMKELRELTKLTDAKFVVKAEELDMGMTSASVEEIEKHRPIKRMDALLRETLGKTNDAEKILNMRFLLNPYEILTNNQGDLTGFRLERMSLSGVADNQTAQGTGKFEDVPCQMILRSVGYKGTSIDPSIPFDSKRGVVVTHDGGRIAHGLYAAGWLKRGPTGIVGTNIPDAHETVNCIIKDIPTFNLATTSLESDLMDFLIAKNVRVVDWNAYLKIHAAEIEQGQKSTPIRPRVKFETTEQLIKAAFGE